MVHTETAPKEDYLVSTYALMQRVTTSPEVDHLMVEDSLSYEAALGVVATKHASELLPDVLNDRQEAQGLSEWHSVVAEMCSGMYAKLQMSFPNRSSEELNEMPGLSGLNALRRGIRAAMDQSQKDAHGSQKRRGRHQRGLS